MQKRILVVDDDTMNLLRTKMILVKEYIVFTADSGIKALEKLTGMNLPDDQLKPLVAGIKAKLAASDLGGKLDGLKKLF